MNPISLPIQNQELFKKAFIHRSYLNENGQIQESNERLEYLGDAVLELVVSEFLFQKFPQKPEGELTALRASLVKTTTLAQVATKLNFGSQLKMSKGEEQTGGRSNQSLLANTFEAVIGAIYLDQGYNSVKDFVSTHLFPLLDSIIENQLYKDYKSQFQEKVQAAGHPTPAYHLVSHSGPDHDKTFIVSLHVGDIQVATGQGKSKQLAQQDAARLGLKKLDEGLTL